MAKIAFVDPRAFFNADGSPKPINEIDDQSAAAIEGIDIEELYEHYGKGQAHKVGVVKKLKYSTKVKALELLGKYRKLFTEKIEVTGLEGLTEALSKARKRSEGK